MNPNVSIRVAPFAQRQIQIFQKHHQSTMFLKPIFGIHNKRAHGELITIYEFITNDLVKMTEPSKINDKTEKEKEPKKEKDATDSLLFLRKEREAFAGFHNLFWSVPMEQGLSASGRFSDNNAVYKAVGKEGVQRLFEGKNSVYIVYGQTGSMKSTTLIGLKQHENNSSIDWECYDQQEGLFGQALDEIFDRIENSKKDSSSSISYEVELVCFNLHCEQVCDLFVYNDERTTKEKDDDTGVVDNDDSPMSADDLKEVTFSPDPEFPEVLNIDQVSRKKVTSLSEAKRLSLIPRRKRLWRATTTFHANNKFLYSVNTRSPAIFEIRLIQKSKTLVGDSATAESKNTLSSIKFVDLPGSERIRTGWFPGMGEDVMRMSVQLGKAMSNFRKCCDHLMEYVQLKKDKPNAVRLKTMKLASVEESKFTTYIQDMFVYPNYNGNNSDVDENPKTTAEKNKTFWIGCVKPHEIDMEDSIGTLRWSFRFLCSLRESRRDDLL